MPITLPHAHPISIDLPSFLATWKIYVEVEFHSPNWTRFEMPILNRQANFDPALIGLDSLCRLLSRGRLNTMQVSQKFMDANARFLEPVANALNPQTGRQVNGARLTADSVWLWNELSDDCKRRLELDAEQILSTDQDNEEDDGVEALVEAETIDAPAESGTAGPANHSSLISENWCTAIAKSIHTTPFQPQYRKQNHGPLVDGWHDRWQSYFWPNPIVGPRQTLLTLQPILLDLSAVMAPFQQACEAGQLAQLSMTGAWPTQSQQQNAVNVANRVFLWGGVPQKNVTTQDVFDTLKSAVLGTRIGSARMNSGWTKLAAFATDPQVLNCSDVPPQVIWDSRVSASVIRSLDTLTTPNSSAAAHNNCLLRLIPGRGGFRPAVGGRLNARGWQSGWGTPTRAWQAHFCGGRIVQCITDAVNANPTLYGSDPSTGGNWSLRSVEMVLFMDGY